MVIYSTFKVYNPTKDKYNNSLAKNIFYNRIIQIKFYHPFFTILI